MFHPLPGMPFDISKASIDRKIGRSSPAGFFVHFIESGCRGLPCQASNQRVNSQQPSNVRSFYPYWMAVNHLLKITLWFDPWLGCSSCGLIISPPPPPSPDHCSPSLRPGLGTAATVAAAAGSSHPRPATDPHAKWETDKGSSSSSLAPWRETKSYFRKTCCSCVFPMGRS